MDSIEVVEKFDFAVILFIHLLFGLKPGIVVDGFFLDDAVKRFYARIVVAILFAAHAGLHTVFLESYPVIIGGIL